MKFVADENFPAASVKELIAAGHEVLLVSELIPGARDLDVLKLAVNESATLLTMDSDFGELIFLRNAPCPMNIVYFRGTPLSPSQPAIQLKKLLVNVGTLDGSFVVLEQRHFRRRKLPETK